MIHRLLRPVAVTACLALGAAAALTAAPATLAAASSQAAHRASSPVVLINGDQVLMPATAGGHRSIVTVGGAGREATSTLTMDIGGQAYVIPADAVPFLGRGLDPGLFELSALQRLERGGRLPVRVSYRGRRPALPGVTITRSGGGVAYGYLSAASAPKFGAALARRLTADHARGSYGSDGMFTGGVSITLPGAAARRWVSSDDATSTLTVHGTTLSGQPDTGDLVTLVRNCASCPSSFGYSGVFRHGTATFRLPAGRYLAFGDFTDLAAQGAPKAEHLVILPEFRVSGNKTVSIGERAASSKIIMVTPRPSVPRFTIFELIPPGDGVSFYWGVSIPLWVSPTTSRHMAGTLRTVTTQTLSSPPGVRSRYEYSLAYRASGAIPRQRYLVRVAGLATVRARYYQDVPSRGIAYSEPAVPGQFQDYPGGPEEIALTYPLDLPGTLTQYLTASPRMAWSTGYWESVSPTRLPAPYPSSGGQSDSGQLFRPGQHVRQAWGAYPLHPVPDTRTPGAAVRGLTVASASRSGNTLSISLPPFGDNQPGHTGIGLAPDTRAKITGSYQIDEDGKKIAGGNAVDPGQTVPPFITQATLRPGPSVVRLTLNATRTGKAYRLSTASRTVWTWRSARESGATLPAGWICASYWLSTTGPTRSCAAQPLMTLNYQVRGLRLDGTAPPGRQVLVLTAGHLELTTSARVTSAHVQVSFNGGRTWVPARMITLGSGRYRAVFTAPAGAYVTLRTSAANAAGGAITETITRGYQTMP